MMSKQNFISFAEKHQYLIWVYWVAMYVAAWSEVARGDKSKLRFVLTFNENFTLYVLGGLVIGGYILYTAPAFRMWFALLLIPDWMFSYYLEYRLILKIRSKTLGWDRAGARSEAKRGFVISQTAALSFMIIAAALSFVAGFNFDAVVIHAVRGLI
jgi:hypothetical protein